MPEKSLSDSNNGRRTAVYKIEQRTAERSGKMRFSIVIAGVVRFSMTQYLVSGRGGCSRASLDII